MQSGAIRCNPVQSGAIGRPLTRTQRLAGRHEEPEARELRRVGRLQLLLRLVDELEHLIVILISGGAAGRSQGERRRVQARAFYLLDSAKAETSMQPLGAPKAKGEQA